MKTRRSKQQPKRPRRYGDVRVANPVTEFHTVRLHATQGVKLVLGRPSATIQSCSEEAEFAVEMNSPWMFIESIEQRDNDRVYNFAQRYDLGYYARLGAMGLGSLTVSVNNNKHPKADNSFRSNLCMRLEGDQDNIVTVVNPYEEFVKLEPHQCLEVICYEPSWNVLAGFHNKGADDRWKFGVDPYSDNAGLVLLQQEVAGDRSGVVDPCEKEIFAARNRWQFPLNPHLTEIAHTIVEMEYTEIGKPYREHHYWFGLNEEGVKNIPNMRNGSEMIAGITFEGTAPNSDPVHRSVYVVLSVIGKNKRKPLHPVYRVKVDNSNDVCKRQETPVTNILTNPSGYELVEFNSDFSDLTVEIAQPSAFCQMDESARWDIKVDGEGACLKMTNGNEFLRWGKWFQRITVTHDYKGNDHESKFLGAVVFSTPEAKERTRRLAFWLTPKKGASTPSTSQSSNRWAGSSSHGRKNEHYQGKHYPGTPKVATDCAFTEVDYKEIGDGLKTYKVDDIKVGSEGKKKRTTACSETTQTSVRTGRSLIPLQTLVQSATSTTSRSTSGGRGDVATDATGRASALHFDLANGEVITMCPDMETVIRMPPPSGSSPENPLAWAVEVGQANYMEVASVRNFVLSGATHLEVVVKPKGKPPHGGQWTAGTLKFTSTTEQRLVGVVLDMVPSANLTTATYCAAKLSHKRLIPAVSSMRAGNYRYVREFQHRDGVLLTPEQAVYIRLPDFSPKWSGSPSLISVQHPLPTAIYQHKSLDKCREKIDQAQPWFVRPAPMGMGAAVLVRPLKFQQPYLGEIIEAFRASGQKSVPIADLTFTSRRHEDDFAVESSLGIVESRTFISRTIHIVLDVEGKKVEPKVEQVATEVTVIDPPEHTVIQVKDGYVLKVVMFPRLVTMDHPGEGGMAEYPWYIQGNSENVSLTSLSKVDTRYVFTFNCCKKSNAPSIVKLASGTHTRTVYVNVS